VQPIGRRLLRVRLPAGIEQTAVSCANQSIVITLNRFADHNQPTMTLTNIFGVTIRTPTKERAVTFKAATIGAV